MPLADICYLPEQPTHDAEIDLINEEAFGPGRFARAAYRIREGGPHDRALSFVAVHGETVIASVRMTPIMAGEGRAMLLGPLAVRPAFKNIGIGRKLLNMAVGAAGAAGIGVVVLVGDEPYYGPHGFKKIPEGQITMPRPVNPERLLAMELRPGALDALQGDVVHAARQAEEARAVESAA
jgi:predicted N-acetyltransferase YhbS